jgi:hypothetical protein
MKPAAPVITMRFVIGVEDAGLAPIAQPWSESLQAAGIQV